MRSWFCYFLLMLALVGCQQELYRNLSEEDANQMALVLLRSGLKVQKETLDSGKTWVLSVNDAQVVQAMEILRAYGLPQQKFADLGEIFKKDGLVSTPTQERVRFIYGISQELSRTLSEIDGVIAARVHIVIPDNDPLEQKLEPSSASVFIKYRPDANVNALSAQIKNLVSHSVEGLTYQQVSVTTVPAEVLRLSPASSASKGWWVFFSGFSLFVLVLLGGGWLLWQRLEPQHPIKLKLLSWCGRSSASTPSQQNEPT